jgi:hypothetical protein
VLRRSLAISAGAVAIVIVACSGDEWSYDGPRSACSTGTPDPNPTFDNLPTGAVHAPECIARCGVGQESFGHYGVVWTVDALPRGACEHDGEVCQMNAVRTRDCEDGRKIACSLTGYACRCEDDTWHCYQGPVGASACVCTLPDSGVAITDAAPKDASRPDAPVADASVADATSTDAAND